MRLSTRLYFILFSVLIFGLTGLSAQVLAGFEVTNQHAESAAVISIQWSATDEQSWHVENDGRLDIMALETNIASGALRKGISGITTYSFSFTGPSLVEMLFTIKAIGPGEELLLMDANRGEVIFDLGRSKLKSFLTPQFDPVTTLLVWKCSEDASCISDFSIENIYYQPVTPGRSLGIGFGTAFPCHPNTACKQDSMLQLIAASAVRIKLVMEEGIGWCTGSFVNNTRNDKTPYLLTAFHCQYDYTPKYDMWRFDFQYTSPTCTNPTEEPQYFSLTGCERISGGQASDFLLVLLDDEVPLNQDVTFAGWDHDDTAKPDTSYLIHHPNADITKISTCVDQATIHPNQIGWSEGYTTPAFHHFRFKFTEGGHEPGSSGGPLFNQDGYLVGQLHGGTAGCESTNNTFIGRFSKSWNLGATPQERLSDWLDPDQTGLTKIPSIKNISPDELIMIHGVVSDPFGVPLKNTTIKVTGSLEQTVVTSDDGLFQLNSVNRNGQYIITPSKNDHPTNGLNALDLVAIQKHLLGKDTFDFPWQFIAADATNNTVLSVGDIVVILRLLLGKIQAFPFSPSWRFDPPQLVIESVPMGGPVEIGFTGIKIGDLNGTADPKL